MSGIQTKETKKQEAIQNMKRLLSEDKIVELANFAREAYIGGVLTLDEIEAIVKASKVKGS